MPGVTILSRAHMNKVWRWKWTMRYLDQILLLILMMATVTLYGHLLPTNLNGHNRLELAVKLLQEKMTSKCILFFII